MHTKHQDTLNLKYDIPCRKETTLKLLAWISIFKYVHIHTQVDEKV